MCVVYVNIYTYMYTHIPIHLHRDLRIHIYVHKYKDIYMCMYVYTYLFILYICTLGMHAYCKKWRQWRSYRVVKTRRMPYLYRLLSAKEPYN